MAKTMNKEFVTYEQALALEELGFDEQCMADCMGYGNGDIENGTYKIEHTQIFYPNDWITSDDVAENLNLHCFHICGIPLKQQVLRWFREKYDGQHWIGKRAGKLYVILYVFLKDEAITFGEDSIFNTYEEAENTCIDKLIELAKQQYK
jgi:hypothetical protein